MGRCWLRVKIINVCTEAKLSFTSKNVPSSQEVLQLKSYIYSPAAQQAFSPTDLQYKETADTF